MEEAKKLKRMFAKLSPAFAADGVMTHAELLEITTRAWGFKQSSEVLGQLDVCARCRYMNLNLHP